MARLSCKARQSQDRNGNREHPPLQALAGTPCKARQSPAKPGHRRQRTVTSCGMNGIVTSCEGPAARRDEHLLRQRHDMNNRGLERARPLLRKRQRSRGVGHA